MTDAERDFLRLLAELASDGLFDGRVGVAGRIMDAFDAAIEAQKREKGGPAKGPPDGRVSKCRGLKPTKRYPSAKAQL